MAAKKKQTIIITRRQLEIMKLIMKYYRENSRVPTMRYVAAKLKIKPPSVLEHFRALIVKGYLEETGDVRKRYLLKQQLFTEVMISEFSELVKNQIAEQLKKTSIYEASAYAILKIDEPDSMFAHNGMVLVKRQPLADNNSFVAAKLDDELVIGRLRFVGGKIFLERHYPDIGLDEITYKSKIEIIGKVVISSMQKKNLT